jgi:hypothetical protein
MGADGPESDAGSGEDDPDDSGWTGESPSAGASTEAEGADEPLPEPDDPIRMPATNPTRPAVMILPVDFLLPDPAPLSRAAGAVG